MGFSLRGRPAAFFYERKMQQGTYGCLRCEKEVGDVIYWSGFGNIGGEAAADGQ